MKQILIFLGMSIATSVYGQWFAPRPAIDVPTGDTRSMGRPAGSSTSEINSGTTNPTTPTLIRDAHYNDSPQAHYEGPLPNNDGRISMLQGVAVPYPYLREADVKFRKRIWRRIDTRQKMNTCFTWPGDPITRLLYEMATNGKVKAYNSDSFSTWKTPEQVAEIGSDTEWVEIPNWKNPGVYDDFIDTPILTQFHWDDIKKFEIVEDWIFDYKLSEFTPRIIGIAPIRTISINSFSIDVPMFWLKMDDLRPTLAKSEVFNRYNDAMRMSWDDLFNHYRLFDSYIVKQSFYNNLYLNQMPEYQQDGLAALLEGENIKNDLFIFEHDLWEY